MESTYGASMVWPPRTPPGATSTANGRGNYPEYATNRGPNALFSPQAEAVKSVGDVIAAIDFDNDMHQKAADFQHALLEALLRLWCTEQSVAAVQMEVQDSLAELVPSELVRLHLLRSFTQSGAFEVTSKLPDADSNGSYWFGSVATPDEAADWQPDDTAGLQNATRISFADQSSGRGLNFGTLYRIL
jgi:hypothetical protein